MNYRRVNSVRLTFLLTLAAAAGAATAFASDWQQIGLNQRPSWVSPNAERRLRLVDGLRGIENTLASQSNAYLGTKGPGMSVGLVLSDGLYYSRGFGFRDAAKSKAPDEQTVFCIGSFTKVFTGTTLLALRDAGELDLGDPVSQYVPEISSVRSAPCPHGGCHGVLRLRHLISHTAGLPNEMEPAIAGESDWLNELSHTRFDFWPGDFSAYSGVGVEMAGLVIKRVTHKSYTQAVTDLLLSPLSMNQSTFDISSVPASRRAQNWDLGWNANFTAPHFTADSNWPDRKMLTAAGYLLSSVRDLARFDKIWLTQTAPSDILAHDTLVDARDPLIPASTSPIPADCDAFDDGHGSFYSACDNANVFGANWVLNALPTMWHNGSTGICGSDTKIDPDHKMAITGLISTDPFPAVPSGQVQPASIDRGFMFSIVDETLGTAVTADAATDWQGQELAIGVARYLWVLGAKIPTSGVAAFRTSFIAQFTPAYRTAHHLTTSNVAQYIGAERAKIGACSTFRVRRAPSHDEITLRLLCAKGTAATATSWDATLTIEASGSHRIASITNQGPAPDPY
ncbi:MAG: serine hydrolase domain-containing protein [Acidobacteriota bacterium]